MTSPIFILTGEMNVKTNKETQNMPQMNGYAVQSLFD